MVRGAFALLDLIAFFTAGEDKPAQSWHLRRGPHGLARRRARSTPTSSAGFVRAEVIGWEELVDAGGYAGARDRGTLRLEGRDYVMADGDVITVKFTPPWGRSLEARSASAAFMRRCAPRPFRASCATRRHPAGPAGAPRRRAAASRCP